MLFSTVNYAFVSVHDCTHRIGEGVLPFHPAVFFDRVEVARNAPIGNEVTAAGPRRGAGRRTQGERPRKLIAAGREYNRKLGNVTWVAAMPLL